MELKTFVSQAITQISEGIKEAQAHNRDATISPKILFSDKGTPRLAGGLLQHEPLMVSFDVAVTVSETDAKKGGGTINVFAAKVGAEGEVERANSLTSRISFEIPVVWPDGK